MDWSLYLRLINAAGALACLWMLARGGVHQWSGWNRKTRMHFWALAGWIFVCIEGSIEQVLLDTEPGPRTIVTSLAVAWTLRALTIDQELQAEPVLRTHKGEHEMSNVNPNPDTDYSPAPGTPQTPYKAYAATVMAFLSSFVAAWIADDNGVTGQDVVGWVVSALIVSGLAGGAAYQTKNKALSRRGR